MVSSVSYSWAPWPPKTHHLKENVIRTKQKKLRWPQDRRHSDTLAPTLPVCCQLPSVPSYSASWRTWGWDNRNQPLVLVLGLVGVQILVGLERTCSLEQEQQQQLRNCWTRNLHNIWNLKKTPEQLRVWEKMFLVSQSTVKWTIVTSS